MNLLMFGHSFSEFVALILLPGLAFYFLNKKTASVPANAEDADTGASDPSIASTETISGGSSPYPVETNDGGSGLLTALAESRYDVFLSFRGLDTRHGFTDHLYNGLLGAGIDVFRDDDELRHGENIGPELLAAIKKSKILIPILSENYGTSGWCLDELVQMMECKKNTGQIVLPVFYKVKPADVRHQIGSFGDAFREREGRLRARSSFDPTISEKWKKALNEVGTLKGYEADGYEGELVKSIVQKVLSELKEEFELVIPENLVGIDGHVEKVMKLVDNNSSATLFVGICGMGGIGKTTLAKAIYNKLSNQFEYRSFIADIRESCRRSGLDYLQNQLIFDVLKKKNQVSNKDDGIKFISSKFKDKKVLILVDDVDDHDQLKALVGKHNWFSSGSRILITTRNNSILDNVGVDHKYEHEEMDENQSMILFSRHAFRRSSPPTKFEDLARDVIITTGRLPLSLEVLGSFLCGKEPIVWRATIDKLKKVPHKIVREKLRISYEELDDGQKQIFLDIACFFIGTDRRIASYMWDASGFFPGEAIEVLRFMSLIKIGDDHKIRMHDQLRDLGREIVREENQREPQFRSRLWDYEEVQKVLKENKGTDKIEAISLSEGGSKGCVQVAEQDGDNYTELPFKNLTSLRFLQVKSAHICGDFMDSIKELRWLEWRNFPMKIEVKNFHLEKLVVLDLSHSAINEKWEGWSAFKTAEKLKCLNLSHSRSLERLDLLKFECLKILKVCHCNYLVEIQGLNRLGFLEMLDISGCTSIERLLLPKSESLKTLYAVSCQKLAEIQGLDRLEFLERLDVSNCTSIERLLLPKSESQTTLLAVSCEKLAEIQGLDRLEFLEKLDVSNCTAIERLLLPKSESLKTLYAVSCEKLAEIQGLDRLEFLESLDISNCTSIVTLLLPKSKTLKTIYAVSCKKLTEIQGLDRLESLERLDISNCTSIESRSFQNPRI